MSFYWRIRHESNREMAAGTIPYATEILARAASQRERMLHGWTMGDGYYDVIEEADDEKQVPHD